MCCFAARSPAEWVLIDQLSILKDMFMTPEFGHAPKAFPEDGTDEVCQSSVNRIVRLNECQAVWQLREKNSYMTLGVAVNGALANFPDFLRKALGLSFTGDDSPTSAGASFVTRSQAAASARAELRYSSPCSNG